jgi:hypothetical protein
MTLPELLATVVESLRENAVSPKVITKVVADLEAAAAEEKADKAGAKAPKVKGQVVILALDPQGRLAPLGDLTGYALQIEEGAAPAAAIDRIKEAALSFNRTPKGRRTPVLTIGETLSDVKGKHWKDEAHPERRTRVLTKDGPVQILPIVGTL